LCIIAAQPRPILSPPGKDKMERRNGSVTTPSAGHSRLDLLRELSGLREEKSALFEKSGDAIFVVHQLSGEIIDANGKAALMTGYPVSALKGMNLNHLIPDQDTSVTAVEFNSQNGNGGTRAILKRQDGASIYVDINACFIHRGEKSLAMLFVLPADRRKSRRYLFATDHFANAAKDTAETIYEFPNIIGKSEKIRKICQLIGQVAKTDSTVLIQGKSGTGKEIVAQAIHFHSLRAQGPFVKVNCASLAETLLESELFGHVKGAFTGAIRDRRGRFMQADGGTILLDEISSMSLSGQAKLLRVLEEMEFEPVGSSATVAVNVRVIVACNTNLKRAVAEGKFREDLFYRLNVFSIFIPPLRDRKEDIPFLAQHFMSKYSVVVGKLIHDLAPETLALMMHYDWPGNVRELRNAVEHAVIVAQGPVILPSNLPSTLTMPGVVKEKAGFSAELSLREKLNLHEKQIIQDSLTRANGYKKQAAAMLRIDPRNFPYLLRKHNLI